MRKVAVVIPARYASSRLPGKPMLDIGGKPMIQHVYERAKRIEGVESVHVATDSSLIVDLVENFGGSAILTSSTHVSGTDRLVEVAQTVLADVYVNLQGDEPFVNHNDIEQLIKLFQNDGAVRVATLAHRISDEEAENPNYVKVVLDGGKNALYFSRAKIPFARNAVAAKYYKHVGVYAYTADVLSAYTSLPRSTLEEAESLEQLRLLQAGIHIRVLEVVSAEPGVDTPECLARAREFYRGLRNN